MQLAGHPHELDLVAQIIDQRCALPLRPARILELAQQEIGLAVFLQHGDALRLGRMRGEHRADAQIRDAASGSPPAPTPARAASASTWLKVPRSSSRPRSRSTWRRRRMAAFCSAMERSWNQMPCACSARAMSSGVKSATACAAFEQRLDLGLMPARHVEQEPEQKLGGLARRGAGDQRPARRQARSALPSFLTSSFMTARHSRRGDSAPPMTMWRRAFSLQQRPVASTRRRTEPAPRSIRTRSDLAPRSDRKTS